MKYVVLVLSIALVAVIALAGCPGPQDQPFGPGGEPAPVQPGPGEPDALLPTGLTDAERAALEAEREAEAARQRQLEELRLAQEAAEAERRAARRAEADRLVF